VPASPARTVAECRRPMLSHVKRISGTAHSIICVTRNNENFSFGFLCTESNAFRLNSRSTSRVVSAPAPALFPRHLQNSFYQQSSTCASRSTARSRWPSWEALYKKFSILCKHGYSVWREALVRHTTTMPFGVPRMSLCEAMRRERDHIELRLVEWFGIPGGAEVELLLPHNQVTFTTLSGRTISTPRKDLTLRVHGPPPTHRSFAF
jgi:hypothetical protein